MTATPIHKCVAPPLPHREGPGEGQTKRSPLIHHMKRRCLATTAILAACTLAACVERPQPINDPAPAGPAKYGPLATRLYLSPGYIRHREAPDYWALSPYYTAQQDDRSCSVACVAMLVNALRANRTLPADEPLVTQAALLERADSDLWRRAVAPDGEGVTLDELAALIERSLAAYDIAGYQVRVTHVEDTSDATLIRLRADLDRNERFDRDFIIINFLQSVFTGDPQGAVGHMAPIAAYDAAKRRILVLDPDRQWYEPYWVSLDTLAKGMATRDPTTPRYRGYVVIELAPNAGAR